jgi:hypothetical protein
MTDFIKSIPFELIKNIKGPDAEKTLDYVRKNGKLPPVETPETLRRPPRCPFWAKLNSRCDKCKMIKDRCIRSHLTPWNSENIICIDCAQVGTDRFYWINQKCFVCKNNTDCLTCKYSESYGAVCLDCLLNIIQDLENGIVAECQNWNFEYK